MTNALENMLEKATKDASFRDEFYRTFCCTEVFVVPLGHSAPHGNLTLKKNTSLILQEAEYQGKCYIPVFSSLEFLAAFIKANTNYMAIRGIDLLGMVHNRELLLNPGAPYGKIFTSEEMRTMLLTHSGASATITRSSTSKLSGFIKKLFYKN